MFGWDMIDKTTKLLMALIAVGLWLNAAMYLLRPAPVRAQSPEIESLIKSIESDLGRIQRGTCSNDKIC